VYRFASQLVRGTIKGQSMKYCEAEQRQALIASTIKRKSNKEVESVYGVKERTLQRDKQALMKTMNVTSFKGLDKAFLRDAIHKHQFNKPGPVRMLTTTEDLLIASLADQKDQLGHGLTRQQMKSETKSLLHEKGVALTHHATSSKDFKRAEKYLNAAVSDSFLNSHFLNASHVNEIRADNSTKPFQKVSNLSQKRAIASLDEKHHVMISKVEAMYQKYYANGKLTTERPEANQVSNFDEIGVEAEQHNNYAPTFTLGRKGERGYRVVTGEHSEFWITIGVMTTADGDMAPWTLIHQSAAEGIRGHFLSHVPDDFIVGATESGYMDVDTFERTMIGFAYYLRKKLRNNLIHFVNIDGHYSHFSSELISELENEWNIILFFLQSNNSIKDQPNDNGTNAVIAATLRDEHAKFKQSFPNVPMDPYFANKYIANAYFAMTTGRLQSHLKATIIKSYEKTKLHPIGGTAVEEPPKKRPSLVSRLYLDDTDGQATDNTLLTNSNTTITSITTHHQKKHIPHHSDSTIISVNSIEVNNENKDTVKLAISAVAYDFLSKSFITPASEVKKMLNERDKAKKSLVPKPDAFPSKANNKQPDTSTGSEASALLEQLVAINKRKNEELEIKDKKHQEKTLAKAQQVVEDEANSKIVQAMHIDKSKGDWQKLLLPQLKSAYRGLKTGASNVTVSGTCKKDIIALIEACLSSSSTSNSITM